MAFRLNKYENCGKVLKRFDAFGLYRVTVLTIGTLKVSSELWLIRLFIPIDVKTTPVEFHVLKCFFIFASFSRLFDPALEFGIIW